MPMTVAQIRENAVQALNRRQFLVYYQPQFDHADRKIVGAEALVRWFHPEYGLQSPADFIPVFEDTGLISRLDIYVFEEACRFLRRCMDDQAPVVPISVNISRQDLYNEGYLLEMERIRKRFGIPVSCLRMELTENSSIGGNQYVKSVVDKFHSFGYLVEMDDFGSGYSSLNALKDIDFDVIKLDMKFFSGTIGGRGGTILSSVVQMCNWLGTPMIAEGVESREQADYMRSIGCSVVQGSLYAQTMSEQDFLEFLRNGSTGRIDTKAEMRSRMDVQKFWNPESAETLIFNHYVGGAAIFWYQPEGELRVIRINEKYLKEQSMNLREQDVLLADPWAPFSPDARKQYEEMLLRAIRSGEEQECETWRTFRSESRGEEKMFIRSTARLLGKIGGQYLFFASIRNITAERERYKALFMSEQESSPTQV